MELVYSDRVVLNRSEFLNKVRDVSNYLKIDPNWLMHIMFKESRLNPQAVNPDSGATGLIQFMPNTAKSLGTTTQALRSMSNVDQLNYVQKYFEPYRGKLQSLTDAYFAVFFPAAIGWPDSKVLQTRNLSASKIASQNSGIDFNKDGTITVGEVKTWLLRNTPQSIVDVLLKKNRPVSNMDPGHTVYCQFCGRPVVPTKSD